ncbi:hypothetical protein RclHR1_13850006 [Rhizophagus clarus]|uniref:Regulator of G-protein signaling 5-like n=1 Tax=Rhizophagus clarus TaxID=94130 RepID=A0A2Z6R3N6_9GLOM|nr:hypothetical protein RclHR1_13850006 [Rhizophagus clarus]GES88464.1 regulator of G-protein signaling 5-like [Rhizophagus clarus]
MNNNNSLHRSSTRRRPSVIDTVAAKFNEEKSLLAAKTPNIISKRRGSTVSLDSIQSNSRRNSIVMIDSITTTSTTSSTSSTSALLREITTTTTTTTLISEIILSQPMNTDEFITKSSDFSSSKLHFPLPPPPPPVDYDDDVFDDNFDYSDDDIFSDDDLKKFQNHNKKHVRTLSQHAKNHHIHHSRSLSSPSVIPSFNSQRPLIPSINYDNHNEYKQRTINSCIKLNKFFGDKPPIDICVKEIEKEGLKAMLQSKIPLCYFLYSLLEEYSCENLFFFLEVEQYESFDFDNSTQQYATAQHIFDTYLTHNSQFEVNVDDKVRKSVISSIKSQRDPKHCFDEAKRAIFVLLEVSFARFIRSPMADLMKQEIGGTTTHYTDKARDAAVILLFRYLEKKNGSLNLKPVKPFIINSQPSVTVNDIDLISPLPSPSLSISRKRNDLICTMIYEFLRTLLEIDVESFYYEHFSKNHKNKSNEKVNEPFYNGNHNNNSDRFYAGSNGSSSGGIDDEPDIWSNDDECIEMMNTGKKISTRDQLKKKPFRRPTIKSKRKIKGN